MERLGTRIGYVPSLTNIRIILENEYPPIKLRQSLIPNLFKELTVQKCFYEDKRQHDYKGVNKLGCKAL